MPVLMFKVSTERSPHKSDSKEMEDKLRRGVEGKGGRLVCLHSGGGGVAYGIVEGPNDYGRLSHSVNLRPGADSAPCASPLIA